MGLYTTITYSIIYNTRYCTESLSFVFFEFFKQLYNIPNLISIKITGVRLRKMFSSKHISQQIKRPYIDPMIRSQINPKSIVLERGAIFSPYIITRAHAPE